MLVFLFDIGGLAKGILDYINPVLNLEWICIRSRYGMMATRIHQSVTAWPQQRCRLSKDIQCPSDRELRGRPPGVISNLSMLSAITPFLPSGFAKYVGNDQARPILHRF